MLSGESGSKIRPFSRDKSKINEITVETSRKFLKNCYFQTDKMKIDKVALKNLQNYRNICLNLDPEAKFAHFQRIKVKSAKFPWKLHKIIQKFTSKWFRKQNLPIFKRIKGKSAKFQRKIPKIFLKNSRNYQKLHFRMDLEAKFAQVSIFQWFSPKTKIPFPLPVPRAPLRYYGNKKKIFFSYIFL